MNAEAQRRRGRKCEGEIQSASLSLLRVSAPRRSHKVCRVRTADRLPQCAEMVRDADPTRLVENATWVNKPEPSRYLCSATLPFTSKCMFRFNRSLASILALLIVGAVSNAATHDWPQWRGPERNGTVPADVAVPSSLPSSPAVVWHKPVGFAVASPVVAGGKVIYLDNQDDREVVHAVDAKTGDEVWHVDLDAATHDTQSKPGPRTTPMVDDDRVYAQSCRGTLKCLNLADGKLIWESNYVKDFKTIFIGEKGPAMGGQPAWLHRDADRRWRTSADGSRRARARESFASTRRRERSSGNRAMICPATHRRSLLRSPAFGRWLNSPQSP